MKGIFIKDLLTSRKTILLYLLIIVLVSAGTGDNGAVMMLFYAIMLPVNLIAYDERSRFERLAPMLPVSSMDCVLTKYVFAYGFMALAVLVNVIRGAVMDGVFRFSVVLLMGIALCLLSQAITLPLIFRFGVQKGQAIYLIAIVVQAGLLGALGSLIENQVIIPQHLMGVLAFAVALMVNVGSIFVSAKVYEKRLTA